MCPAVAIGNVHISCFNICIAIGIITGLLYFEHNSKQAMVSAVLHNDIIACFGADIPFIILGALIHNKLFLSDSISEFISIIPKNTGIAFLGGLLGGIIGFLFLHRLLIGKRASIIYIANIVAPSIPLGHAIGRIGCFFGGCCYGKPCKIGVIFCENTPAFNSYGGIKLFPIQLLEAFLLILIFLIIKNRKNAFVHYIITYSVVRFVLEYFRGDSRGNYVMMLSPAQIICICLWICFLAKWIFVKYKTLKVN